MHKIIKEKLGLTYVTFLAAIFTLAPLFSYFFGTWSDYSGRKKWIISAQILLTTGLIFLFVSQVWLLIIGGIILSVAFAILLPIFTALLGDISNDQNVSYLAALFWMARNIGLLSALILSRLFISEKIFLISAGVIILYSLIIWPIFRFSLNEIKKRLEKEINS